MDNRILSAHPSMSRSTTTLSHEGPTKILNLATSCSLISHSPATRLSNFFEGSPFDSKQFTAGHKLPCGDLSKVMTTTLGISPDDLASSSLYVKQPPSSSLEELKRLKTIFHYNSARARDRVKILNDAASKFDKCFDNILTRKRSRCDVPSNERSNSSLLIDSAVFGGIVKMQTQSQTSTIDFETSNLEEKTKNGPNNRTRTSMLDVQMDLRATALTRSHGSMERNIELSGLANVVQSEEKDTTLSNTADNWEKSRMKKKRSGIKPKVSRSTILNKPLDGDQKFKRDMQQQLSTDVRSRSSNTHGFRSGVVEIGKSDVASQKAGLGLRSTPVNDQDNGSHFDDRRYHLVGPDKERVNTKTFNSSCPSSTTKMNTVTRAPRSGPVAIPKASHNVHRFIGVADEWELSENSNKIHIVAGANNRKRAPSPRSSFPPVAQWAGQRPQKIPRVARRSTFVPPVLGHDDTPVLNKDTNISGNDSGPRSQRRSPGNFPQQVKSKGDHFSSPALSLSEESGAAKIKSKDKSRKSGEKGGQNLPKVLTQILPPEAIKEHDEEFGLGGSFRRQGRTVRGFTTTRSANPMTFEKRGNTVRAKQLRGSGLSFDKIESKTGGPPTKKLSARRTCTHPRRPVNTGVSDFHGESDDGQEELLAAANAAVSSGQACSSTFWRQMEVIFGFVSSEDISYLRQQIAYDMDINIVFCPLSSSQGGSFLTSLPDPLCEDESIMVAHGFDLIEYEGDQAFTSETRSAGHVSEQRVHYAPSIFQRLLSAFIVEGDDGFCSSGQEDFEFDVYANRFLPDIELEHDIWNQRSLGNIQTVGRPASNGYRITASRRYLDELENDNSECADIIPDTNVEIIANYGYSINGFELVQALAPSIVCTQSQYNKMSMLERLLLELQSVGIFCEPVSDLSRSEDEEISEDITRLEDKLDRQVLKKKEMLSKLEKSVTEAREIQQRDIHNRAFDKLVGMAYRKYMACWGPYASCGKGMSGKIAKQAALSSVKETIERCRKFESTSESCFNEAVFMDLLHSVPSLVSNKEGGSSKFCADSIVRPPEVAVSAPLGSHPNPSLISQSGHNMYSSDDFQSANHISEQCTGKEDTSLNRIRKRELLLGDVVGGSVASLLRPRSGIGGSVLNGAKGKRSDRDRDGKSHNREMQSKNGTAKIGRPSLGNAKGETKAKTKLKQRTTQLSTSANDLLGKTPEISKQISPSVHETHETITNENAKKNGDLSSDMLSDHETIDLSNLQLPEMDILGVPDDLGEQGQDLGSWLSINDDGLQDHDFMEGLEIPMDDLSDLNMAV